MMNFDNVLKLIGLVGAGVAIYFIVRYWQQIKKFIEEVFAELKKVNWTPRPDLINTTFVVIVATICLGCFITLCDLILSRGLNAILR